MIIETTRFGALEVDENALVNMPSGPLGFESYTRFCMIERRANENFRWLQSVEEPSLAFVVVDPTRFFADYEVEISDTDVQKLGLTSEEDAVVVAIVTIRSGGQEISINLAAPVVINSKNLMAAQIVLQDERYTTQHVLGQKQEAAAKAA